MDKKLTNAQSLESNLDCQIQANTTPALQKQGTADDSKSPIVLESVRSNLIAVIGYELWNPLSTIQVCLESLAREPEIPLECKQVILDTAFEDIKYLHQLIEDCVTFSQIEPEAVAEDCIFKSPTVSQAILNNTILRTLELSQLKVDSDSLREFVNNFVVLDTTLTDTQKEIQEHIRHNLIAIVGHEIRTPLCTIEICLESLSNEPQMFSEYRQQMLDIALKDINRLQQLIQDFFILDRLEKGQVYYRSKYVRVRELVYLALDSLKKQENYSSLPQINLEIPPNLPLVKVDEDILIAALIKLLDNACKFTKSTGEVKIQAQLLHPEPTLSVAENTNNIMLEVIISDTGRGIVPQHLEAIFNCFYQEEDFLRRTVNGTGIGLTICRRIINSLGGQIWAKSLGRDCGSSIHFTLPVAV